MKNMVTDQKQAVVDAINRKIQRMNSLKAKIKAKVNAFFGGITKGLREMEDEFAYDMSGE